MHTNISQGQSHHTLCEAILQLVKATQHKTIGDKKCSMRRVSTPVWKPRASASSVFKWTVSCKDTMLNYNCSRSFAPFCEAILQLVKARIQPNKNWRESGRTCTKSIVQKIKAGEWLTFHQKWEAFQDSRAGLFTRRHKFRRRCAGLNNCIHFAVVIPDARHVVLHQLWSSPHFVSYNKFLSRTSLI